MSSGVGADIESICGKCGDVWHVVVAKVGDRIVKVQCKQCGGYHRYRPVGGAAAAPARRRSERAAKPRAQAPAPEVPAVEPDLSRPVRPYRISETFEPGDRIDHATFGAGVVEAVPEPGKIRVFVPDGRRILAQAKPGPRLEPPPPLHTRDTES